MPGSRKPKVAILHHLARTGGTLMSRCLGSMRTVYLLSEAHPLGMRWINPVQQAVEWHRLMTPAEARVMLARGPVRFDTLVALLAERAAQRGRTLVVRDWTHLDFHGVPYAEPGMRCRTAVALAQACRTTRYATVRHPIDQWVSVSALPRVRETLGIDAYLAGCHAFARTAARLGFGRYEDFTRDPEGELRAMCRWLRVEYDPSWRTRWTGNQHVTGDTGPDRARPTEIRPSRRRSVEPGILRAFERNDDYWETLRLLGYEHRRAPAGGAPGGRVLRAPGRRW